MSRTDRGARFLYDDDNLYVGFFCFDSDPAHMTINGQQDYNRIRNLVVGSCQMIKDVEQQSGAQINVALNWFEELKRLVPTER